jgi:hypothetical protein
MGWRYVAPLNRRFDELEREFYPNQHLPQSKVAHQHELLQRSVADLTPQLADRS